MTTAKPEKSRANPEGNRAAMIEATLDAIAEMGIADTTVSKIIERAGVSRGMINLHFGGKAQLLSEAAKTFNEQYYAEVDRYIELSDKSPEGTVNALIMADLGENLLDVRSTRIWHAFRGLAITNSEVADYSDSRDARSRDLLRSAFEEIAQQYPGKDVAMLASNATYGVLVMLEGLTVDFMSSAQAFSRDFAKELIYRFLTGLFPNHFQMGEV